ncbi:MAG: hypothetical protein KF912_04860 [Phycisphaeraceae bacterium]|nr:hypothetical protein [Phycisphaeraceae bacterium]
MSSPRVCYVERMDRGVRVRRARLVGFRADDEWTPAPGVPGADTVAEAAGRATQLASWIRDRLAGSKSSSLDVLCIDADASACTWIAAPSYETPVVEAVLRQRVASGGELDGSQPSAISTLASVLGDRAEVSVQPIAEAARVRRRSTFGGIKGGGASNGSPASVRVPVMAVPDASVRLLTDELDRLGVTVQTAMSIWHAAALAWDAGWSRVESNRETGDRVVSESAATQATILVDGDSGRLLWVWSRGGLLVAAGSMLVPTESDGERSVPRLGAEHASRLATEFLSWGVQTGASPARTIVVTPESETVSAFGHALTSAMPGTTVDVAVDADPIGATMRRVAERVDGREPDAMDPRSALISLGARPSRSHRSMYRWAAGAVFLLAACVGAAGWRVREAASDLRDTTRRVRASASEAVARVRPSISGSPFMAAELETELVGARRRSMPPDAFQPARPILSELDGLSFLLSLPTLTLDDIELSPANGRVTFFVPDTAMAQEIEAACREIDGLSISWKAEIRTIEGPAERRVRCTLTGVWPARAASAGGGS